MSKRIRPARIYQRRDAPIRLLAQHGKGAIKRDIKAALTHLGEIVDVPKATHALRSGAYGQVQDAVAWGHFGEVLKAPFERIARLRESGAALGVRKINGSFSARRQAVRFKKLGIAPAPASPDAGPLADLLDLDAFRKAIGTRFNFDRFDTATLDRIRAEQDRLIGQLTADARDSVDSIVMAGVRSGLSPEDIVGDIRELIGLTDTQARAVLNYRSMLESLDPDALRRQLRNRELDPAVQAALADGTPLDAALIDRATTDYEDNYLDYRAATIAQTESVRATNAGLHDAYQQAVERGALPDEAVRRHWQVDLDERTCPVCLSIPDLNPDGVGVDEQFESDDGPQDDPPVHPNCRCSIEYITDLDKVPDEGG